MKKAEKVKNQIRFMCKFNNISVNEEFVDFVYNKSLSSFSGVILKQLKEEFNLSK